MFKTMITSIYHLRLNINMILNDSVNVNSDLINIIVNYIDRYHDLNLIYYFSLFSLLFTDLLPDGELFDTRIQ